MEGLKFKYLSFSRIKEEFNKIAVWIDNEEIACGAVDDVLEQLNKHKEGAHTAEYEIQSTHVYLDTLVIEL